MFKRSTLEMTWGGGVIVKRKPETSNAEQVIGDKCDRTHDHENASVEVPNIVCRTLWVVVIDVLACLER